MAISPSTDNYTLGKGIVYFNQLVSTGVYAGERDLGNAPAFAFNLALEKLEHYSSRGGLRAKDKEIISQISPGVSFTLDEINAENVKLLTLGDSAEQTQTGGVAAAEVVVANEGLFSDLDYREVGSTALAHGSVTNGPFQVGETVTGGTSTATGTVTMVGTGVLYVATTDTFQDAEVITGGTSTASATTTAAPAWTAGVILVQDDTDTTTYVAGTDYSLSTQDAKVGRIFTITGGSITDADDLHITYQYATSTYTEIYAFKQTQLEGKLRFVSDNPAGTQQEVLIHRVSLAPSGDTAYIGDDWSTLAFTGEVLKDESNTTSPYMTITMTD